MLIRDGGAVSMRTQQAVTWHQRRWREPCARRGVSQAAHCPVGSPPYSGCGHAQRALNASLALTPRPPSGVQWGQGHCNKALTLNGRQGQRNTAHAVTVRPVCTVKR